MSCCVDARSVVKFARRVQPCLARFGKVRVGAYCSILRVGACYSVHVGAVRVGAC